MKHFMLRPASVASAFLLIAILAVTFVNAAVEPASGRDQITALSTDPSRVTGGDVLLQITVPDGLTPAQVRITANGKDATAAFRSGKEPRVLVGLVTGLANGKNTVEVYAKDSKSAEASLTITNYPITGPVFSGPQIKPFICETDKFKLPDGTTLGPPLDANCSAKTVVQYVYRTTGTPAAFKPLPAGAALPADLSKTTTTDGTTMNFIVRVETGTADRGIYQNAILFDPASDAPPTPFAPPKGWNHRLVAIHGSGCPTGWYHQGAAEGVSPLDAERLGQGYALFVNTLNHPTNSCNANVAGEVTMMGKEHFIETFGVPLYTMSTGGSGGAYTSLQVADSFPGLIDGVNIRATFPDALAIAMSGEDGRLLMHYFSKTNPAGMTEAQKVAVSGYPGMKAFADAANQSQRMDPVPNRVDIEGYQSARWNDVVPEHLRYDPQENPRGARPTVFDVARNIYGINPATGAALRPFDNMGVQYGLNALNDGIITPAQFLDLNEKIGGIDEDSNYTPARAIGDAGAIKRAHQAGLMLSGKGGLASIPVFDNATKNELAGYHYGWFDFALRDRLRQANGNSDNLVIWRSTTPEAALAAFDKWMVAYTSDKSADPARVKAIRSKPKEAVEGCYDKSTPPQFIAENLMFTSKPVTKCSELYPVYSNPRKEAGGPLAANVLRCQLKPIDPKDYKVSLSTAEMARLKTIFSAGTCDFTKPGVNQTPVVPWASWGPNPDNLLFDVSR